MSGAQWGIGVSSAVDGFARGLGLGRQIKDIRQEREIENLTTDGMDRAKAAREQQIGGAIKAIDDPAIAAAGIDASGQQALAGAPPADGIGQPPAEKKQRFQYGDQTFDTMEEARKAAEKDADGLMDFFMRDAAPQIRDAYMKQGRIEEAEKFGSWMEQSSTKAGMKHWVRAVNAAQLGDTDTAVKYLAKTYNTPGYFDDGYEASKAEVVKDKDGKAIGMRVTMKGRDGKEFTRDFNGVEDMLPAGIGLLAPQSVFEHYWKEGQSAKESRLGTANKAADRAEDEAKDKRVKEYDHRLRMNEIDRKAEAWGGRSPGGSASQTRAAQAQEKWAHEQLSNSTSHLEYRRLSPDKQRAYRRQWMTDQGFIDGEPPAADGIGGGDDGSNGLPLYLPD